VKKGTMTDGANGFPVYFLSKDGEIVFLTFSIFKEVIVLCYLQRSNRFVLSSKK